MTAVAVARVAGALAAALLVLAGCGTPPAHAPASPADAPPRSAAEAARENYEAALRAQAAAATADKHWNDAALAWELLATVRPDDRQVAERLADSRARTQAAAIDLQARAEQAERRGDVDGAVRRWWAVLAIDPSNAAAATALRKLESERNRKLYLGRHAGRASSRRPRSSPGREAPLQARAALRAVAPRRFGVERSGLVNRTRRAAAGRR